MKISKPSISMARHGVRGHHLDLLRVLAILALDLAVEVLVHAVDAVHVLVRVVPPPPAVVQPLLLPARRSMNQNMHHMAVQHAEAVHGSTQH